MTQLTPQLHAKGSYNAISPFVIDSNITYECIAIRTFKDLKSQGIDILGTYYVPVGLTQTDYQNDLNVNANIITLASNNNYVYIPDTWLASYPITDLVPYTNLVLSALLGPLPDSLDLSFLIEQVGGIISDTIGVVPTVKINKAPSTGVITTDQSKLLETARQSAINNRTTDHARIIQLQNQITLLNEENQILTQLLIANGLLPTT